MQKTIFVVACVLYLCHGIRLSRAIHRADSNPHAEDVDLLRRTDGSQSRQFLVDMGYGHRRVRDSRKINAPKMLTKLLLAFSIAASFNPSATGVGIDIGYPTLKHHAPRIPMISMSANKFVLGLNKYSHDAGCTLLPINDSWPEAIITVPKERVSRKKHDAGDVASSVRHALAAADASLEDVVAVCANNHHNRIAPFEHRLPWSVGIGTYSDSFVSADNLLPGVPKFEMSHHLAHAWSAIAQAPFERGLVVVMDGMGETLAAMESAAAAGEDTYLTDLQLEKHPAFTSVPPEFDANVPGYREAETAYAFEGRQVRRVFKRWIAHRSPPELYNHGFEDLESLGALYSRISSHIFGHWNVCGKVMGLAPWVKQWVSDAAHGSAHLDRPLLHGQLEGVGEDALHLDWQKIETLPHPNGFKTMLREAGEHVMEDKGSLSAEIAERRGIYTALAARVQTDLEEAALSFLHRLRERTGEKNLIFVGGVAQNSVLNGRIAREVGFEQVFIPPYPGDEGISVGCATFAQQILLPRLGVSSPPMRHHPWSAFQGKSYEDEEIQSAIEEVAEWLEEVPLNHEGDSKAVIDYAAKALAKGEIIGWVHGRAEVGARALGHRSILADPTRPDMHRRVNIVKQREQYRPLAPSVIEEEADKWFDGIPTCGSPYMQFTASVRAEARDKVPAITHVDGSARLQTVSEADAPLYHMLIKEFSLLSGVPIVMDTSFNLAGMPIVDSPSDALECFFDANPDLSLLVLFGHVIRRRPFPDTLNAIPRQGRSFVSRSMSDAYGEALGVEVLVEDKSLSLTDALELEILERCSSGEASVDQLGSDLVAETGGEVTEEDVIARLRHLYALRLIAFV